MIRYYSIHSKSSGLFDTPFPCENDKRAIYELRYLINSVQQSAISQDPSDHSLYRVASFDGEFGFCDVTNVCLVEDLSVLLKKGGKDV